MKEEDIEKIVQEIKSMSPAEVQEALLRLRVKQRIQAQKAVAEPPRLMLTIYVKSLEDAQRTFNALQVLKESGISHELERIPSLDWDTEWEETE